MISLPIPRPIGTGLSRGTSIRRLLLLLGLVSWAPDIAFAQEYPVYQWVNPGIDNWQFGVNWELVAGGGNGIPSSLNDAWVDNGGTTQIIDDVSIHDIVVGRAVNGHLEVRGPLGNFTPTGIIIGSQGIGTFTVAEGGKANGVTAMIGSSGGSKGSALVSGIDSEWLSTGDITIGDAGEGALVVSDAGHVSGGNAVLAQSTGALGSATISGLGSEWINAGALTVARAGTGTMSISAGGYVSSGTGIVGEQLGGLGTVTIDGAQSAWQNEFDLSIGHGAGGNGLLSLTGGGRSISNVTYLGRATDAIGSASVEDPDSQLQIVEELYIGYDGDGLLTSMHGGQIASGAGYVGWAPEVDGTVAVDGAGSQWTNSGELHIGIEGTGSVTISGGAELHGESEILVSRAAIGNGTLLVTGLGSQVITSGELRVADEGMGRLRIEAGATVSSGRGVLGNNTADAVGTALISGVGSNWSLSAPLLVGRVGQGVLTLADGGSVTVNGDATVGSLGRIEGDGTVVANVVNGGVVSPGASPGELHINGNYTQSAEGKLQIGLTSPTSFDKLEISGSATLGGTLEVLLDEGYIPQGNPSFDVLDWGTRVGTFSSVILPTLGDTITWDTSQLYTSGIISVVGESALGDYNDDGLVDAADYTVWRDTLGQAGANLAADGSGNDVVDQDDYDVWKANFGAPVGNGTGAALTSSAESVPEPGAVALAILAAAMLMLRCRLPRGWKTGSPKWPSALSLLVACGGDTNEATSDSSMIDRIVAC